MDITNYFIAISIFDHESIFGFVLEKNISFEGNIIN